MRKYLHLSGALLGLCLGAGCSNNHVGVEAKSDSLATHHGEIGRLNSADFAVGDIVEVDSLTHQAWKAGCVQVNPLDLSYSQPKKQAQETLEPGLELAYSKKVPGEVKEEVSADLQSGTVLHVQNYWTRGLKNPAMFVAGSEQVAKKVAKLHAEHPADQFFLVSAVNPAEKVYMAYDAGKANTLEAGKYDFHVKYAQNEALAKLAKEKAAFFQLTPLKVEEDEGKTSVAVDKEASDKLPDSQLASTW